jgi:hypothetical protein
MKKRKGVRNPCCPAAVKGTKAQEKPLSLIRIVMGRRVSRKAYPGKRIFGVVQMP